MKAKLICLLCLLLCEAQSYAACVYMKSIDPRTGRESVGSGVCIGRYGQNESIILTAKHLVQNAVPFVQQEDSVEFVRCRGVMLHPDVDAAVMIAPGRFEITPLANYEVPVGEKVRAWGAGPHVNKIKGQPYFYGQICKNEKFSEVTNDELVGEDGAHIIPGDSGGPIEHQGAVVGLGVIVTLPYVGAEAPTDRKQYPNQHTVMVKSTDIVPWLKTQYRCPPGVNCPIQLEPVVQQPMIGFGMPWGPPRVVQQAVPARPRYIPEEQARVLPAPVPDPAFNEPKISDADIQVAVDRWMSANRSNLQGKDGRDGKDGTSVDPDELAEVVGKTIQAVVNDNPERFRGPPGPTAVPSKDVLASVVRSIVVEEMAKIAGDQQKQTDSRISALENRETRVILTRNRKVVDDEVYPQGKPIILDLEKILQHAKE